MKFLKYNSIDNADSQKYMDLFLQATSDEETFYVQEKIHGANFSFYCDGENVSCAKRSSILSDNESFFNFQNVKEKYENNVRELFKECKEQYTLLNHIVLYGELFGGVYPHTDVPQNHVKAIQKGVFYSPNIEFMAFDLKLVFEDDSIEMLSIENTLTMCKYVDIPTVPTFAICNQKDAISFQVENVLSKVPEILNLPPIEKNFIEGVVVKPNKFTFMKNGSRAILKIKTKAFLEVSRNKSGKKPKITEPLSEHIIKLIDIACDYITDNRYNNMISKEGIDPSYDIDKMGKFIGLFNGDVIQDFIKDNEEEFKSLEKSDQKKITKHINTHAAKFIKEKVFKRG